MTVVHVPVVLNVLQMLKIFAITSSKFLLVKLVKVFVRAGERTPRTARNQRSLASSRISGRTKGVICHGD